ncbi:hypothetical protein ACFLT7_07480 [candidate division KSB1 bacterium]
MMEQAGIFLQSVDQFFSKLASYLPQIIGAVVILIFGWIVAKLVKSLAVKLLHLVRLNVVTEKAGVDKFLKDGGMKTDSIQIIGGLFYWLIMLIVLLASLNSLGLGVASELFNQIVLFIPNIIVSIIVLVLGLFFAKFIAEVLGTYLKNVGFSNSDAIGKVAQYAIIVFVISLTLTQLNIGQEIVLNAFQIFFGAVCFALALAFGLGGREWAARIIDKVEKK